RRDPDRPVTRRPRPGRYKLAHSSKRLEIVMRPIRPLLFAPLLIAMAACSPQDPVDDGDPPYDPATRTDAEMPPPAPAQAPAGVPADGERDDAQAQAATATLQPTQGNDTRGEL